MISYGLETLRKTTQNETSLAFIVLGQFESLVTVIAAQALRLGFLVRGAIAIGNLYHAGGVVFGEALVEQRPLKRKQQSIRASFSLPQQRIFSEQTRRSLSHT